MRLSFEHNTEAATPRVAPDSSAPDLGVPTFPFERRFGRLQLDDQNLYATTFTLQFADAGTTRLFWPFVPAADVEVL